MKKVILTIFVLSINCGLNATYQGSWLQFFDQIRNACDAGPEMQEIIASGIDDARFTESFNHRYNTREKKIANNYKAEKKHLETIVKDHIDLVAQEIKRGVPTNSALMAKGGIQITLSSATLAALIYINRLFYENENLRKEFWAMSVGSIISLLGSYLVPKSLHWDILAGVSKSANESSPKTIVVTKESSRRYTVEEKPNEFLAIMQVALFWGKLLRWSLDSSYNGIQNLKRGIWYQLYLAQKKVGLEQIQKIISQGCHEEQLADIEA